MRKNLQLVFEAWRRGESRPGTSINTDGNVIRSYTTPIVKRTESGVLFNHTNYSKTTTAQQNSLRVLLRQAGVQYEGFKP